MTRIVYRSTMLDDIYLTLFASVLDYLLYLPYLSMSRKHWKNRHVNPVNHLPDPPLSSRNPAPNPARPTLTRV